MKKILLPFLFVFIFSCSSDSDSDLIFKYLRRSFSWLMTGTFCELDDATSCSTQTLVQSNRNERFQILTSGEQWTSDLEWSATSSTITVTTLIDNLTDTAAYELSSDEDNLTINNSEGMVIEYNRM